MIEMLAFKFKKCGKILLTSRCTIRPIRSHPSPSSRSSRRQVEPGSPGQPWQIIINVNNTLPNNQPVNSTCAVTPHNKGQCACSSGCYPKHITKLTLEISPNPVSTNHPFKIFGGLKDSLTGTPLSFVAQLLAKVKTYDQPIYETRIDEDKIKVRV
jgi:hypothetical protein